MCSKPTDKQMYVINIINQNLGTQFNPTTKNSARQIISENIEKSRKVVNQERLRKLYNWAYHTNCGGFHDDYCDY